jgi:transposase
MQSSPDAIIADPLSVALEQNQQLRATIDSLTARLEEVTRQLNWFKRQLFGQKSERRHVFEEPGAQQLNLSESFEPAQDERAAAAAAAAAALARISEVKPHLRQRAARAGADEAAQPFFDAERVPIETIELPCPLTAGLSAHEIEQRFEPLGVKHTYRLAQRPGSFVVLQYERPQFKERTSGVIACAPAPTGVLEGSRADVSFIAAMAIEKIAYHMPLYRQHQKLAAEGFRVSRAWLTQLVQQACELLTPIYTAQFDSVRASRVKAMDETPIRAGLAGPGKMNTGYFWPVYGELDEVCFAFHPSRSHAHVLETLGLKNPPGAVLLSDGYAAYDAYVAQTKIAHARCWAHLRRYFFEAKDAEPQAAEDAMQRIAGLYRVEEKIREAKLTGAAKQLHRAQHSVPIVRAFFDWVDERFAAQDLLPSNPLTEALAHARNGRVGFEVFLTDPDVPIDTNHLERALRGIPMGKKAWLFAWTELGARHIGLLNSLIVTCRLHEINPYDYLVDVLQRINVHPNHAVAQLTPRLWKQHFAANPMRSDLDRRGKHC